MPETRGQPEPVESGLTPEYVRAYNAALRMPLAVNVDGVVKQLHMSHTAAQVAASRPLYLAYVTKVDPIEFMAACQQPDDDIEAVNARLMRSGRFKIEDLPDPRSAAAEFEPEPFTYTEEVRRAKRQGTYNAEFEPGAVEPWLAGLPVEELDAVNERPTLTLREQKGIKTDGDPNRPSQRLGARWARKKRQRARERLGRQSRG